MSAHHPDWYLLTTAARKERAVVEALARIGLATFVPMTEKPRRLGGRGGGTRVVVRYPMFPRYVFVQAPFCWPEVLATTHVGRPVGFDGTPAPIAHAKVAALRTAIEEERAGRLKRAQRPRYMVGDRVRLRSVDAFNGLVVTITGLSARKARFMLSLFGRLTEGSIDQTELAKGERVATLEGAA